MISVLLLPLALTVLLEGAVMLALSQNWRCVYYSVLCNLLTNPLLNLVLLIVASFSPRYYAPVLLVLELGVVFLEGQLLLLLTHWPQQRAVGISLGINSVSFLLGILLQK